MNKTKRLAQAFIRAIRDEFFQVQSIDIPKAGLGDLIGAQPDPARQTKPNVRRVPPNDGPIQGKHADAVATDDAQAFPPQPPDGALVEEPAKDGQVRQYDAKRGKWGNVDPGRYPEGVPAEVTKLRLENEKLRDQCQKWRDVADGVRWVGLKNRSELILEAQRLKRRGDRMKKLAVHWRAEWANCDIQWEKRIRDQDTLSRLNVDMSLRIDHLEKQKSEAEERAGTFFSDCVRLKKEVEELKKKIRAHEKASGFALQYDPPFTPTVELVKRLVETIEVERREHWEEIGKMVELDTKRLAKISDLKRQLNESDAEGPVI